MATHDDDKDTTAHAGRRLRRQRNGFGFTAAHISDSTVAEGERLNDRVERMSLPPQALIPPPSQGPDPSAADEFNPGSRMEQVRQRASQYEREYRLGLMHRMIMRNIPLDQIANDLRISISQAYRDRDELKRRLREEARSLDIDELIGDSKGFYEEAAALSLRAASMASTPLALKLAAIRTGLAAKNDMHRMFQTAGVYDVLRFRVAADGGTHSDVRRLMEAADRLFEDDGGVSGKGAPADSGDAEEVEL